MQIADRLDEDTSGGDELYEIYMAKKKTGKPKDDYPNQELAQRVKDFNISDCLFTVVYTD